MTVKPTGCGFDPHSRRWNIYLNLYYHFFVMVSRQSAALSSATQHAMPSDSGRKWGTECLNIMLPPPTLLCAGYSMKLIKYPWSVILCHYGLKRKSYICFKPQMPLLTDWKFIIFFNRDRKFCNCKYVICKVEVSNYTLTVSHKICYNYNV